MKKIAIVTGASRGLGFATAQSLAQRKYKVILAMRNPSGSQDAVNRLKMKELDVVAMALDVGDEKSIDSFVIQFRKEIGALDVLVNNAGIFIDDSDGGTASALKTKSKTVLDTFMTNTMGPFLLTQKLFPLLLESDEARVVNVSSGMGQLSEMSGGYAAYRISKTALNAVTRIFANQGEGKVLVNSVCPGWVKTDMGGAGAHRTIEEGISGIIWAATLPKNGPNGGFFRDGKPISW